MHLICSIFAFSVYFKAVESSTPGVGWFKSDSEPHPGNPNAAFSNIVFILLDDQDVFLGGMEPMEKTRKLLQKPGVEFTNMFATTPLCCPSRSSILTGRYAHNHLTRNNSLSGNCSSTYWQNGPEKETFTKFLKERDYTTFYAGKYLNQYGDESVGGIRYIPPGWDWWFGLAGNSRYYNYTLSVNGTAEHHGDDPDKDYLTNVIAERAVEFLKLQSSDKAFFMMLSPPSPHAPFTPMPKYKTAFSDIAAPRIPSFNISSGKTKHWLPRQAEFLSPEIIDEIDEISRNRWRTLLSVDDLVETVVNTLDNLKLLSNTYIFYSSDNGFHLGEFSLPWDKRQPYEFDIRVPLLVRGPGISPGTVNEPVLNLDLAPTFIDLVGLSPGEMDGKSLFPFLYRIKPKDWRQEFLVEHQGEGTPGPQPGCPQYDAGGVQYCKPGCICQDSWNNTYDCIRTLSDTKDFLTCHFHDQEGFVETYNITSDPYQLNNLSPSKSNQEQQQRSFFRRIQLHKYNNV